MQDNLEKISIPIESNSYSIVCRMLKVNRSDLRRTLRRHNLLQGEDPYTVTEIGIKKGYFTLHKYKKGMKARITPVGIEVVSKILQNEDKEMTILGTNGIKLSKNGIKLYKKIGR